MVWRKKPFENIVGKDVFYLMKDNFIVFYPMKDNFIVLSNI